MRILLLSKRFDFGGSENHVCELANSLVENGHQVWLFAARGRQISRLNPHVHFLPMRFSDGLLLWQIIRLVPLIRSLKIEVIHAHQRLAIKIACLVGKMLRIPVVATVHGRTRHDLGNRFFRKMPAQIIFISRHVLQKASRFPEITHKSVFIPNGIVLNGSVAVNSDSRLLYISRIDKHHGKLLLMLINEVMPQLARQHPQLTLVIVGDGRNAERVCLAALKLNENLRREVVVCHGFQSETEDWLSGTTLLLGVGRTAMKALSLGVPVLSLNHRHLGPIITTANFDELKNSNFVFVKGAAPTPQTLLPLLLGSLENSSPNKEERNQLKERVAGEFNLTEIRRQVEAVYYNVLN
jgi:glycosyltransferase involved in cell wall biosynthesis